MCSQCQAYMHAYAYAYCSRLSSTVAAETRCLSPDHRGPCSRSVARPLPVPLLPSRHSLRTATGRPHESLRPSWLAWPVPLDSISQAHSWGAWVRAGGTVRRDLLRRCSSSWTPEGRAAVRKQEGASRRRRPALPLPDRRV